MAGMGLPLNGPAEPAMLELLRRRIRQLPQQMLTGEQGHTELDVATNGSQQEPFVPEWRRTRPAVAPASAEAEANGNAGMGSAGTTTGSLNTVLSDPNASPSARQPVRLGPNEMEQIVQRVYRELQRRLKSDYQRRGM